MSLALDQKIRLRTEMKDRRDGLDAETRSAVATVIRDNFLAMLASSPAKTIAAYWPRGSEVDVRPLMQGVLDMGRKVTLPCIVGDQRAMEFRAWEGGTPSAVSGFGIPQPDATARKLSPDIIITPLLAFDRRGHRLGFGRGFYDRTFYELRLLKEFKAVGVAYAVQEVPQVPNEKHDMRLDWVMTERGSIQTGTTPR